MQKNVIVQAQAQNLAPRCVMGATPWTHIYYACLYIGKALEFHWPKALCKHIMKQWILCLTSKNYTQTKVLLQLHYFTYALSTGHMQGLVAMSSQKLCEQQA